ncbi:hypothetical protein [Brevundimonas sp.]|uniref:hypothetical protein n=1 Tax=Brevundimonas sp. TaxID=1871086 RepID=UPI00289BF256|nr:hypothetical protein [Brevundimonas sp.]
MNSQLNGAAVLDYDDQASASAFRKNYLKPALMILKFVVVGLLGFVTSQWELDGGIDCFRRIPGFDDHDTGTFARAELSASVNLPTSLGEQGTQIVV